MITYTGIGTLKISTHISIQSQKLGIGEFLTVLVFQLVKMCYINKLDWIGLHPYLVPLRLCPFSMSKFA